MKQIVALALIIVLFAIPCIAQENRVFEVEINGKKAKYLPLVAPSLKKTFFDNRAIGYVTKLQAINDEFLTLAVKKVRFVSITRDLVDLAPPKVIKKNGKVVGRSSGGSVSHPAWYQSAILGEKLYVFPDDENEGAEVFNQLIKELKVKIDNPIQAKQLADFFLRFYTIRFTNPKDIRVSKIEDIPEKYRNEKPERVEKVKDLIHPLKISNPENFYQIEFFTWENFPRGEVNKWQIKVSKNGEIALTKEFITII
jgi:hypothetical protein